VRVFGFGWGIFEKDFWVFEKWFDWFWIVVNVYGCLWPFE